MKKRWIGVVSTVAVLSITLLYMVQNSIVDLADEDVALSGGYILDGESQKVIDDVKELEAIAIEYLGTDDRDVINQCVMAFIRKDRYGYAVKSFSRFVWSRYAGSLNTETGVNTYDDADLYEQSEVIVEGLGNLSEPLTGKPIDFIHMVTVVDLELTDVADASYEEKAYDALFSWAGDLKTFMLDTAEYVDSDEEVTSAEVTAFVAETLGSDVSTFSGEDMKADLDGALIADMILEKDLLLSEALMNYYANGLFMERYTNFMARYESVDEFEADVQFMMFRELSDENRENVEYMEFVHDFNSLTKLMDMFLNKKSVNLDPQYQELVADGFVDYIVSNAAYELMQSENDLVEDELTLDIDD